MPQANFDNQAVYNVLGIDKSEHKITGPIKGIECLCPGYGGSYTLNLPLVVNPEPQKQNAAKISRAKKSGAAKTARRRR